MENINIVYPRRLNTWFKTDKELTIEGRLQGSSLGSRVRTISGQQLIKMLGGGFHDILHLFDSWRLPDEEVVWRNYEASYSVDDLEPLTKLATTYVLQEYFVPVDQFQSFVNSLAGILRAHDVNVLNVSIRHVPKNDEAMLSWSRKESFAFVLYLNLWSTRAAQGEAETWTRKLIDSAVALGGTYYLPYQVFGTDAQLHAAYPKICDFFALKKKLDPNWKFSNALLLRYRHTCDERLLEGQSISLCERAIKKADILPFDLAVNDNGSI